MINIEKTEVFGWEAAIRGMRNPMNSWDRSDSEISSNSCIIGPNDRELMKRLSENGPVHAKFRRMITVYADITAPLYWWKEFDTYKVGTVANSCSTMHKIHAKPFEWRDFSCEHLINEPLVTAEDGEVVQLNLQSVVMLDILLGVLNGARQMFLKTGDKKYWWQMIQLLPSSYNQKRTIMFNYEVLSNIYHNRHNHKLDEWIDLCNWIQTLPYSELMVS